jgi:hypothetical protein
VRCSVCRKTVPPATICRSGGPICALGLAAGWPGCGWAPTRRPLGRLCCGCRWSVHCFRVCPAVHARRFGQCWPGCSLRWSPPRAAWAMAGMPPLRWQAPLIAQRPEVGDVFRHVPQRQRCRHRLPAGQFAAGANGRRRARCRVGSADSLVAAGSYKVALGAKDGPCGRDRSSCWARGRAHA